MEKEVDVKSIVKAYLVTHGYDGLYEIDNFGCACKLSDLMPCDHPDQNCRPGHVVSEDEYGFVIGER